VLIEVFSRYVDNDDFVGGLEERLWDRALRPAAGDALDGVLLLGDVLQVNGGDYVYSAAAEGFDLLPPMGETCAGRVVAGEFVDETDLRAAGQHAVDVDHLASARTDRGITSNSRMVSATSSLPRDWMMPITTS